MKNQMVLVVILTVRMEAAEAFRAYEREAASIMASHGGRIERSVVVPVPGSDVFKEVHLVCFPDERAFAAYTNDARLLALRASRERSVIGTEVLVGSEGPDYLS